MSLTLRPTVALLRPFTSLFTPIASSSSATLPPRQPSPSWLTKSLGALGALAGLLELLPPIVLAVPKHRTTHSRKSMRSAHKGLKGKTNLTHCEACGTLKLAHNLCPSCFSQISRRWKKEAREGADK